jgi:hypothetical protein
MKWTGFGRKPSWPNFKVLYRHRLEGLMKTTKNHSQDSHSPGRYLNPGPPECEAGVLTTRTLRSVWAQQIWVGSSEGIKGKVSGPSETFRKGGSSPPSRVFCGLSFSFLLLLLRGNVSQSVNYPVELCIQKIWVHLTLGFAVHSF